MKKQWLGVAGALASGAALLAGCGSPASGSANAGPSFSTKPSHGGTITVAFTSNIETLDPAQWTDVTSAFPMQQIYQTLVTYSPNGASIVPDASTYTVSNGGKTYVFNIKPNLKFSNGDPVTAQDVKYSLDRVTSYNASGSGPAPYGFAYSDIVGYNRWYNNGKPPKKAVTGLAGVQVTGPLQVTIKLKQPEAFFLNTLALESAVILDQKVASQYTPNSYMLHAVGSGPFEVQSWNRGHQLILVPNPDYQGKKPYVSRVVMDENVPWSLQLLRFEKGQLDMINGPIDSSVYSKVLASPKLQHLYHKTTENGIVYLAFNTTKAPFNNKDVRLAVNYALNKALISKDVTNGRGPIASQPLPPGMPGYNKNIQPFPYDPSKAKKLLQEAGYSKGNGPSITMIFPSNSSDHIRTADIVQQELQAVGFKVNLQGMSQVGSYWPYEDDASKNWNLAWTDWFQDYPDPEDFMYNLLSTQAFGATNVGQWTDAKFQSLITKADNMPASEDSQRWAMYQQAETIAHNDASWAFLYYYWNDALIQPWLGPGKLSYYLHPVMEPFFNLIWTNHK